MHFHRTHVVVELRHGARTDDGAGDAGTVHGPAQRNLRDAAPLRAGKCVQFVEQQVGVLVQVLAVGAHAGAAVVLRAVGAAELPAEDAAAERAPGRDAHPFVHGHRDELGLHGALEQAVLDLQRHQRRAAVLAREGLRQCADPGRVIAQADVPHLALPHQLLHAAHQFLDGGVAIPEVAPEEVDVVGLQASQRVMHRVHHGLGAAAAAIRVHGPEVAAELGGDDHAIALPGAGPGTEVVPEDPLAVSLGVDVGGVDEVAAHLQVTRDHRIARGHVGAESPFMAEGHRTEADRVDAEAASAKRDVVGGVRHDVRAR